MSSPGTGLIAGPGDALLRADGRAAPVPADTSATGAQSGRGHWIAIPAFFYTPETGFGGGPAAGYIFPRLWDRHPSSLMGTFFYTEKKQVIFALVPELYTESGFHGRIEMAYQRFPDSYWGIGPDTGDGDEERYTPELVEAMPTGLIEAYPDLRVGLRYRYRREVILEKEEGGELEQARPSGSEGGTFSGAGIIATYDTRDNIFSSSAGWYAELGYLSYGSMLLSDYDYNSFVMDVRRFFPLKWEHVFAARLYSRWTGGNVPFQDMPALGGPGSMRGYQAGRYRDRFAAYAQAEYRLPLVWVTSLALFASAGNVSRAPEYYTVSSIKYAGGGGIRFRVNEERFTIRCDFALTGEGGSNFYLSINEAF